MAIKKELLLAVLNQRLEKAKEERGANSVTSLLAYEAAKAKVKAYEEMIALIESGNFDQEDESDD